MDEEWREASELAWKQGKIPRPPLDAHDLAWLHGDGPEYADLWQGVAKRYEQDYRDEVNDVIETARAEIRAQRASPPQ